METSSPIVYYIDDCGVAIGSFFTLAVRLRSPSVPRQVCNSGRCFHHHFILAIYLEQLECNP